MLSKTIINNIISLRKKGFSYNQITQQTKISKSTISYWCKDLKLTADQYKKIQERKKIAQIKATKASAQIRKRRKYIREKTIINRESKVIGRLSKRDKFIAGISLYMADGTKKGNCVDFTNSDPRIINFMVGWFKEFLLVDNEDIKASLWLHKQLSESRAITYWSKLTKIPRKNFGKTYFAENKIHSNKKRTIVHDYGVIKIRVYSIKKLIQIKGWISGVLA